MQLDEMLKGIELFSKEIKDYLNNPIIFRNDTNTVINSFIKRISLGSESVSELISKNLHYDAHIIAGSLLEALALLDYIVSNNKLDEYYDYGTIMLVKNTIRLQIEGVEGNSLSKGLLKLMKENTTKFLKPKKNMEEVLDFLSNRKKSSEEKLSMIQNSYNFFSYPNKNIENFVDKTGNEVLKIAYETYCELKHYNSSVLDYILSGPSYVIREYSEETLKAQALSLLCLVLFYTNQMIEKWRFDNND